MFQNENVTVIIERDDDTSIFKIIGELDAFSAYDFNKFVKKVLPTLNKNILIDLAECNYISSSGISSLFFMCRLSNELDYSLSITSPKQSIYRLFETVNLNKLVKIDNIIE